MPVDYYLRPMRHEDVAAAEQVTARSFYDLDVRTHRTGWAVPVRRTPERSALWRRRLEHLLKHDAGGCFVAEDSSGVIGVAASLRRETTWMLSTYAVRPGLQGRGVGKQLLDAALGHGRGCLRGMLSASEDPLALRRYHLAGFTLHPMLLMRGPVPRAALPVVERVREGSASDLELMDSVDRRVRDSAHGVDHHYLTATHRLVVADRPTGSGYAYVGAAGGPYLLAATNRRTATDLLWETLAATDPDAPAELDHVTSGNGWAVDVGMAARMELHTYGYLALRGMKPPAPYIPSAHLM